MQFVQAMRPCPGLMQTRAVRRDRARVQHPEELAGAAREGDLPDRRRARGRARRPGRAGAPASPAPPCARHMLFICLPADHALRAPVRKAFSQSAQPVAGGRSVLASRAQNAWACMSGSVTAYLRYACMHGAPVRPGGSQVSCVRPAACWPACSGVLGAPASCPRLLARRRWACPSRSSRCTRRVAASRPTCACRSASMRARPLSAAPPACCNGGATLLGRCSMSRGHALTPACRPASLPCMLVAL